MPGAKSLILKILEARKAGQTPKQAVVTAVRSVKSQPNKSSGGGGGSAPAPKSTTPPSPPKASNNMVTSAAPVTGMNTPLDQILRNAGVQQQNQTAAGPAPPAPFVNTPKGRSDYQRQQQDKRTGPVSVVEQHSTVYSVKEGITNVFTKPSKQMEIDQKRIREQGQAFIDFEPKRGEGTYYVADTFEQQFLPSKDKALQGKRVELTPQEADIYHENIGKSLISDANKMDPFNIYQQGQTYLKEWHPETKIVEYDPFYLHVKDNKLVAGKTEGVTQAGGTKVHVDFPYFGAEQYGTLSASLKKDPGRATALGWGWGGYGNIDIAYYRATGQEQKILDRQVEQLAGYKSAGEKLKGGDVLGFSTQYWGGYLSSPATQIGLAYVTGAGAGALTSKLGSSAVIASHPLLATGGKIAAIGIGGTLIGYQAADITKDFIKGDVGKGLGRSTIFTASLAAGYMGFKHGQYTPKIKSTDVVGRDLSKFSKYKDFMPDKIKNIYGKVKGEMSSFKNRSNEQLFQSRTIGGVSNKQLGKLDIYNMKQLNRNYQMSGRMFPKHSTAPTESEFTNRFNVVNLFKTKTNRFDIFGTPKGKLSEPSQLSIAKLYGRNISREGLSTLEQTAGKPPDPFFNYMAKDVWEANWSAYRSTLPQLAGNTVVGDITAKIDYGKGLTYMGATGQKGLLQVKHWENMFADSPYSSKHPQGYLLESDIKPQYQISEVPYKVDFGMKPSGTPFKLYATKDTANIMPGIGGKGGQLTESIYKGPSTSMRFKVNYDMTDVRMLNFIEGLEPPYQPTTSILAPPHIKQGLIVLPTFQRDIRGPDLKMGMGGKTIFEGSYGAYDFDIIQKPKTKYKPAYETMHDVFSKQDMNTRSLTGFDMTQSLIVTPGRALLTDQLLKQAQQTQQATMLEEITITPPFAIPKQVPNRPYIYEDVFNEPSPFKRGKEPVSPFGGLLPNLGMGGGGGGGGGLKFFYPSSRFRKGQLDEIFGIKV